MFYLLIHKDAMGIERLYVCMALSVKEAKSICGLPADIHTWCSIPVDRLAALRGTDNSFIVKEL